MTVSDNMENKTRKIKVCHLTSVHRYTDNRVFFKECSTLAEKGYDVTLVAPNLENHERNGVKLVGVKGNTNRFKRIFITAFRYVYKEARRQKADIYHFHDTELIPVGLLLRLSGKRVIYDVHENNAAAILSRSYVKSGFFKKFLSFSIKVLEKGSAFSIFSKACISGINPRISVIPPTYITVVFVLSTSTLGIES